MLILLLWTFEKKKWGETTASQQTILIIFLSFFLKEFKRRNPNCVFIFYTWDSFKNNPNAVSILEYFDKKFTFDTNDAIKHNLNFRPLFFIDRYGEIVNKKIKYNLLFLGTAHSDRYKISDNIVNWCLENNFSSYAINIFCINQQLAADTTSNKYHHPMNPELNIGPITCYYEYQVLLYEKLYGKVAFEARNIKEFKNLLTDRDTEKTSRMMEIYTFAKDCNISSANGDRLLKLTNLTKEGCKNDQYTSWKSFDRWIQKETNFYSSVKKVISWPNQWQMNKWDHSNLRCPEEVEIRMRDIMQLIADQCVSPHLQFLWKDDIKIRSYSQSNDKGEKVFCDLMSSDWVFEEQQLISQFDKDGILLPIILYYDGVCPDKNMNSSLSPVMGTLGWYGRKLLHNYCSKFVVGYISELKVSEVILVHHLMKVCKMTKTKALKNIAIFKKICSLNFGGCYLNPFCRRQPEA